MTTVTALYKKIPVFLLQYIKMVSIRFESDATFICN
jgi:hypothetical protein